MNVVANNYVLCKDMVASWRPEQLHTLCAGLATRASSCLIYVDELTRDGDCYNSGKTNREGFGETHLGSVHF